MLQILNKPMNYYKSDKHNIEFTFLEASPLSFESHNHISIYAIGLILDGRIAVIKDQVTQTCTGGDLFIIPPYLLHSILPISGNYSLVTLCLGSEFLAANDLTAGQSLLLDLATQLIADGILTAQQVAAFTAALELVYVMDSEIDFNSKPMISQTRDFIESQPEDPISLDELSERIFVSKYYLIREFKKTIGLSPHRFQIQNRIRKSQHLLRQGASITDVAILMGFYDQSHFIKYFKKIVGITPTEYLASLKALD